MTYLKFVCMVLGLVLGTLALADTSHQVQTSVVIDDRRRDHNPLDQGGDNCSSVYVIGSVPFFDTGTTVGRADDWNNCFDGQSQNAPDVIYRFTPTTTEIRHFFITASFYGEFSITVGPSCPGADLECHYFPANDTTIWQTNLNAGTTYYFRIDGTYQFANNAGTYEIHISDCPLSGVLSDNTGTSDDDSGEEGVWRPSCGISGYAGERFYVFNAPSTGYRTIELTSTFDAVIEVRQGPICPGATLVACNYQSCMAHHYFLPFMATAGVRYWIIVDGNSNNAEGPFLVYLRHSCTFDGTICAPGSFSGSTCGADESCGRPGPDQVIQVGIPNNGTWRFSLCNSSSSWDSYLTLTDTCCGNVLAQNDNSCGTHASITACLNGPALYYVTVEGSTPSDCGDYTLTVQPVHGSCCYGDTTNPQCSDDLTLCQCSALGGVWTEGVSCVNTQCDGRPACQPGAYWGQRPFKSNEAFVMILDDEAAGYRVFDDFFGDQTNRPLNSVRFWGMGSLGFQSPCTEQPQAFLISVHVNDNLNGLPRLTNPLGQYSLVLTGTFIGTYSQLGYDYPVYQYDAVLPMPVVTGPYAWLSVQGKNAGGDPNCLFRWLTGPNGNGGCVFTYNNGPFNDNPNHMSFCVGFTQPCAIPLNPPTSVTSKIVMVGGTQHVQLSWLAPSAGTYEIWSTTYPNNDGNPDGGSDPEWDSEDRVVAIASGAQTWTDTNPIMAVYKNYVILQTCRPPNDECENAVRITNGVTNFTNSGADTDGPTSACVNFTNDVWFKYVALCSGTATVSACGSGYNTQLEIFSGSCTGASITCNDDFCSNRSQVSFAATAGNTYLIRVGGYAGAQGNGTLTISCP